jgi:glycyl-tRNA synthetase
MVSSLQELQAYMLKVGVIYPSSELYGGLRGFYDYGYLGHLLKQRFENLWRRYFLGLHDNFWEVEPAEIMHQKVFVASGHLEHFNDPMVECTRCKERYRADKLIEDALGIPAEGLTLEELDRLIREHNIRCPRCGGELGRVRWFNLMFPVIIGASSAELLRLIQDYLKNRKESILQQIEQKLQEIERFTAYLRPETAQGAYLLFKREFEVHRKKLPLGLAIIGKAFRNEISPRQLLIRLREFTQAELQIFFDPEKWGSNFSEDFDFSEVSKTRLNVLLVKDRDSLGSQAFRELSARELVSEHGYPEFYVYFLAKVFEFYTSVLGIPRNRIRLRELDEKERAFYNRYHFDVEIFFESLNAWKEVAGVHYRTDHDLSGHQRTSGVKLTVRREDGSEFVPHVLELSFGVDRNIMALIDVFLKKESVNSKERIVLKLPAHLAPISVAVFPLVSNKPELVQKAKEIYQMLRKELSDWKVIYDEKGSIGKRYRRQDEIGTPFCVTVDHRTLEDASVTVRERDSMRQQRLRISDLAKFLKERLTSPLNL